MLGVVEVTPPGWAEVLERLLWVFPWGAILAGVLVFPWPQGVRCRVFIAGLILSLIRQAYDALAFFGVFGPPRYNDEAEIPAWLEVVDFVSWMALGMGGMILVAVGAWLTARGVVRSAGGAGGRDA